MGKFIVYLFVVAAFALGITVFWTFKSHNSVSSMISSKLKDEFISYATQLQKSQKLQVAELQQVEVFERTSSTSILWEQVRLPDLVVSISTPVTFTYFIDLNKAWSFELQDKKIVAKVPPLEFNPPAPDLSKTHFDVKKGSIFRNEKQALQSLQGQISALLNERAIANRHLVIETARTQVSQFIMTWLKDRFPKDRELDLAIQFQDEPNPVK